MNRDLDNLAHKWLTMAAEIDPSGKRTANDDDPAGQRALALRLCAHELQAVLTRAEADR